VADMVDAVLATSRCRHDPPTRVCVLHLRLTANGGCPWEISIQLPFLWQRQTRCRASSGDAALPKQL
jgi:hypothetical protein